MIHKGFLYSKLVFDKIVRVDDSAWSDFSHNLKQKSLAKNDFLWREGQTCRHLVYLKKGLIRSLSVHKGREITYTFYDSGRIFYDDYSFLSQEPTNKSYQAIENCELLIIQKDHLHTMYDKYKSFERIGRISIEKAHLDMMNNLERLNQNSAEENYRDLLNNNSNIIQRVSQKIIASYLNITPEHMSRIRSKVFS